MASDGDAGVLQSVALIVEQQAYLKSASSDTFDAFGFSVAISGDTVVVGVRDESSNATGIGGDWNDNSSSKSGAVYVFIRSGTVWSQQAYLKASNTDANDSFGQSVAISGDTLVVGAPLEDSQSTGVAGNQGDNSATDAGAAYVFTRTGSTWSQQAYLKASNANSDDYFGFAVAISGNTIVVGARQESNNEGAAYVFIRSGLAWSQQAYLKASNAEIDDIFGRSVAISGNTIVVGSAEDSNATGVNGDQNDNSKNTSGAAYIFTRSGVVWNQQAYLKASNTDIHDLFGYAVAISGDTVVIGAPTEASNATGINGNQSDNSQTNAGAAYVFTRNGALWSQQAYFKASNSEGGDVFGWSVGIDGERIVVGAEREDSGATGINGNQSDNSQTNAGAAYVFTRNGTLWSQQTYLKASNSGETDELGWSVAIADKMIVAGAPGEDSNATGIDGDQSDNSAPGAGAAYIFVESPDLQTFNINPGLNDAWFNPETSGQGFLITVFPEIKRVFLAWFTFDTERPPEDVTAILGEPGHRWLTAFGTFSRNQAVLEIELTEGGIFDSPSPAPTQGPDGTITLEFSSCNSGTVIYDISSIDRQGVIPIERIALDNVGLCETLSTQ